MRQDLIMLYFHLKYLWLTGEPDLMGKKSSIDIMCFNFELRQ